jgi:hypothetical protein
MTAEALIPQVRAWPTAEFDDLRRAAAAAVSHPGGRLWRLRAVDRGVELRAEAPGHPNPSGPGLASIRIAAGAALLNMRLTIAATGDSPVTTLVPESGPSRTLAILRRGSPADPTPVESALAEVVGRPRPRHSELARLPVRDSIRNLLRRAAEAEGVWLRTILDPRDREQLAGLVPAAACRANGMLVVIGSNHDVPAAQLRAGQGLQRVVLTAAGLGLAVRVLAWPPDLRAADRLPAGIGGRGLAPQVVLEIGRPLIRCAAPAPGWRRR